MSFHVFCKRFRGGNDVYMLPLPSKSYNKLELIFLLLDMSCIIMLSAGWVELLVAIIFNEILNGILGNLEMVVVIISCKGKRNLR